MWVLIDNTSKERVSGRFSSQAALARFMKISSQTLNKAVKEGRTVFPFDGRDVQVVQQVFTQFEVRDSPEEMFWVDLQPKLIWQGRWALAAKQFQQPVPEFVTGMSELF